MKKLLKNVLIGLAGVAAIGVCASVTSCSSDSYIIGIPSDATNQGRALKLLADNGLLELEDNDSYTETVEDITGYNYNFTVEGVTANTLPSLLDDYAACTINGTYAIPYGLVPSEDAIAIEDYESEDSPYVNVICSRSSDVDNEYYNDIVSAFQTDTVANYIVGKYSEAYYPAFDYTEYTDDEVDSLVDEIDNYETTSTKKVTVNIGVCGSSNQYYTAVQKVLDEEYADAGIYIELTTFSAYTLPNDALNSGEIDLDGFQHKAYLESEIEAYGYDIEAIGDTLIAPLSLYSNQASSLDDLKTLLS